ncbi:MAG TPA: glycosyltransferase family 4 protein [Candidatus Didemnitutus sp.]
MLEYRNLAGHWIEFFHAAISVDPEAPPADRPALAGAVSALIPLLLIRHRRRPDLPMTRLAREVIAAHLARPLNVAPSPPLVGALEEPGDFGRVDHGRLAVTGWIGHLESQIVRVVARVDPIRETELTLVPARSDVLGRFSELHPDRTVGFAGLVDFPSGLERPALLTIMATLANGQRRLAFAQRLRERAGSIERPRPEATRIEFARASWALIRAARRLDLSTAGMLHAAHQTWKDLPARRPPAARSRPPQPQADRTIRVVVVTHNLNFEGAPRLLLELVTYFHRQQGFPVRVWSPTEGPLRALYEAEGIPVNLVPLDALSAATGRDALKAEFSHLADQIGLGLCDLVIANTLASFWAVHAARAAGKPSLFYVHESAPPERFLAASANPSLVAAAGEALELADRVVFTAEASRQVFASFDRRGRFVVLPSWLDGDSIRRFIAGHDKAALRAKHGFSSDAIVVLNLGTVCERKGQHVMVQAVEQLEPELRARRPDRAVVFALVGARDDDFGRQTAGAIQAAGLQSVRLIPETRDNLDFHRLADVLVCTSFEESSPRVLLEAALFGTSIVTTDVNGIPEILSAREAHLVPAGDPYLLAAAIRAALDELQAGHRQRADRAAATVARHYDRTQSLPRHAALALAVVAETAGVSTRR